MPSGCHGLMCHGLTIISAAHTAPHRLSAVSGEKVNHFVDFENRQSQIANHKSPDGPMNRWPDYKVE
jgi:hypothetical protein